MAYFAYIDESGTLVEHQIMTVSLVLVDGRRGADKISERILKKQYPHLAKDGKALRRKTLHFADMPGDVQNQIASQLAQEPISAVISAHWHTGEAEGHAVMFHRYTKMVQLLIFKALGITAGGLSVVIAEQGSPETYRAGLFENLARTVDLHQRRTGVFRSVDFELRPALTRRGLQLADFYAGTVRKMWLESAEGVEIDLCTPFRHIKHQMTLEDYIDLE